MGTSLTGYWLTTPGGPSARAHTPLEDVGIDGGVASAEEAAVRIVGLEGVVRCDVARVCCGPGRVAGVGLVVGGAVRC
jgi:hypothetical protein